MATQSEIADYLGISLRVVKDLEARGILPKAAKGERDLKTAVRAYCAHLRERAAGRQSADGLDLAAERARLAKEQADHQALKNAETRRELLPKADVDHAVTAAFARCRTALLRLPAKLASRAAGRPAGEVRALATGLITEALQELATTAVEPADDAA